MSGGGTTRRTRVYLRDLPLEITEETLRSVMEAANARVLDLSLRTRKGGDNDTVT